MRAAWYACALAAMASPVGAADVTMPGGTEITLVTLDDLSSKVQHAGDQIRLKVRDTVRIDGTLVIPADTPAVGQVTEAQGTGGLAVNGKLLIAPLYLQMGGETVRLVGGQLAHGATKADAVAGLLITGLISGRSAKIPAGTIVAARSMRDIRLAAVAPAP